jgi:hypothetical protein
MPDLFLSCARPFYWRSTKRHTGAKREKLKKTSQKMLKAGRRTENRSCHAGFVNLQDSKDPALHSNGDEKTKQCSSEIKVAPLTFVPHVGTGTFAVRGRIDSTSETQLLLI